MDETSQISTPVEKPGSGSALLWGTLSALAGLGLLIAGQVMTAGQHPDDLKIAPLFSSRISGLALLAAGLILLLEKGRLPWFARRDIDQTLEPLSVNWPRRTALVVGLVFSGAASLLSGVDDRALYPGWAALCWLAGIALVIWAGWQGSFSRERAPRWFWVAGADILIAALVLRLVSLQTIPVIFTGDESGFGQVAVQILAGSTTNLFSAPYMGGTNLPFLYDLLQAGSLALFGRGAWAFRLTSALAGVLTVLAVYLMGAHWFGRRTGVFAALILAGNHLHLHFSRYAISNLFDGLFFVLVIGLLWDAWESGERKKYLLAGLALGFSQFFYTSARALPVAALAFFAAALLFERRRLRQALPSIGFFWAAFLVVFLPMIIYYLRVPYTFIAPWSRVGQEAVQSGGLLSAFGPAQLPATLTQIYRGLLGFTVLDLIWLYKPGEPILRALPAVLFLAGAAALLARRRWSQVLLLALWLAAFGFIGGLSDSTPAAQRYVGAVPALALLAAYGLSTAGDLLERLFPSATWLALGLTLAMAIYAGADDARFYFTEYTPQERYADPNGLAVQRLADFLRGKDASTEVVFVGYPNMEYTSIPTPMFFNPHLTHVNSIHNPDELDAVLRQPPAPRVYFFAGGHQADLERVMQVIPGGHLVSEQNYTGETVYWLYITGP